MNKDEVAIYLDEHPEFFNEYPELLRKIKEIKEKDLPIEPINTLSLADRIIKRVQNDKENLKTNWNGYLKFPVPMKKFKIIYMK